MGQYANDIIEGYCDYSGDYTHLDTINRLNQRHCKQTPAERNINAVRKELAILINQKIKLNPDIKQTVLVEQSRTEINLKYGKGWRERGLVSNGDNQWKPLNEYPL